MEKQSRDFCRVQKKKKEGVTMKRKRGLVHVILALLMSMLLIVSTGCGKSGSGDSSSDKKMDKTETLADVNTIPEDGVITKEQFKTVAGENKKVQFKGTTDDGITYIWTYDCSKIQNPADQNLKIDFSEKDLDDLKKQANNANDALKMTMYGKGLICVPDLEVQLPEAVPQDPVHRSALSRTLSSSMHHWHCSPASLNHQDLSLKNQSLNSDLPDSESLNSHTSRYM